MHPWLFATFLSALLAFLPQTTLGDEYQQIEWQALIPEQDRQALSNPPSYEDDLESHPYFTALESTRTNPALHNRKVRIAGYIVPLEFDGEQHLTEFFLVPFAGACIHVPPPPPNHMILVSFPAGFTLKSMAMPYWLEGTIKTAIRRNDLAITAYTMKADSVFEYRVGP